MLINQAGLKQKSTLKTFLMVFTTLLLGRELKQEAVNLLNLSGKKVMPSLPFHKLSISKVIYLLCLLFLINVCRVSSQTLDVTFGSGGKVVTPVGDSSTAHSIIIPTDGKIIAAGNSTLMGVKVQI